MVNISRYLDPTEEYFAGASAYSRLTVEYRGELNEYSLRKAFSILYTRYPVLRATIRPDNHGLLLSVSDDADLPVFITMDGDISELLERYSGLSPELRSNPSCPLSQMIWSRGNAHGYVTLGIDHTIIDGVNQYEYMRELWEIYTALENGDYVNKVAGKFFPGPPSRYFKKENELDYLSSKEAFEERGPKIDMETYDKRTSVKPVVGPPEVYSTQLSPEHTWRFRCAAKERGLTVSRLLTGIAVSALNRCDPVGNSEYVTVHTNQNLRPHSSPPIGALEATYLSARFKAKIPPNLITPAEIGKEFDRQLKVAISRQELRPFGESSKYDYSYPNDVVIQNWGKSPPFATPSILKIVDYFPLRAKLSTIKIKSSSKIWDNMTKHKEWRGRAKPRLHLNSYTYDETLRITWIGKPGIGISKKIVDHFHEVDEQVNFATFAERLFLK